MGPAGKKACLFFLFFMLITALYAEPSSGDETIDNGLFFFEELFIAKESLSFGESLMSGEAVISDESPIDESGFYFEAPPLIVESPAFEIRSFNAIFPYIRSISADGLFRPFLKDEPAMFIPNPDTGIDLLDSVMQTNPSHLIEALILVPYKERELDLLDIYNALGRIENIKDYPVLFNGSDFYIFTESTRIESARNRRAIPDPLPALTLPFSETFYVRLKEINFGNLFLRTDISINVYGITYSMTNFTDVRYFLIPIMKAERYITVIYLEPVKEGVLIYSITGFYLPGFIADRVNLTPNINRRIKIINNWITEGLRIQESSAADR
ncbi:MAG: hypothetical protein FWF55_07175 [Treponema sp.]|nr:hypothetical protein [Treponema sp.]